MWIYIIQPSTSESGKNRITAECFFFARFIPGLARWFTLLKERVLTKGFGDEIPKYATMVFLKLVLTSQF